jgi:hypothetical protein
MKPHASPLLVAALAQLATIESEIGSDEERLKDKKALRKYIGEHVLAELIEREHLNDGATLPDGTEVTFEHEYHVSVLSHHKDDAHAYLIAVDQQDLLKTTITVNVPRGKMDAAFTIVNLLKLIDDIEVSTATTLPGPTLTKWVKEQLATLGHIPACFTVYAPVRAIPVTHSTLVGKKAARG